MADKPLHLRVVKGHAHKGCCPLCRKPAEAPYIPFCSRRCAQLDLGKWLTGDYKIPAYEAIEDTDFETLFETHETQRSTCADDES